MTVNITKRPDGSAWVEPFNLYIPSQVYTSLESSPKSRRGWECGLKALMAMNLVVEMDSLENATIIVDGEELV